MTFNQKEILDELKNYTERHLKFAEELKTITDADLQARANEKSWSVLECLEHLNRYGDFYIPEIQEKIKSAKDEIVTHFKSGYLGNKSAEGMLPKERMKTMNTFKSKNPIHSSLNKDNVLDKFIEQQKEFLTILEKASSKNITKIKTKTTLPLVKFRLGDTLRFVIYHNERHVQQAKRLV